MRYKSDIENEVQTWCHPSTPITIIYGALYNWYAATDIRNIANTGWHVPSDVELETMFFYLDPDGLRGSNTNTAGGDLKEISFIHWASPNTGATNSAKFNAVGHGYRNIDGLFYNLTLRGNIWLSTVGDTAIKGCWWTLFYDGAGLDYGFGALAFNAKAGFNTRLIKDSTTLTHGEAGTYTGNDGKIYRTICIGTQEWLADNLAETLYRDLTPIPEVTDNAAWAALVTGAKCYYNNDISLM